MTPYIVRRLASGILLVWIVLTLIFLAIHAIPGDPAYQLAGGDSGVTKEGLEHIRNGLGLDKPFLVQYGDYLGGVVTGNLGTSFSTGQKVTAAIGSRLPITLELISCAAVLSIIIGLPFGAWAARRRGWRDSVLSGVTSIALAVPVYVFGAVMVLLFAVTWHVLPAGGLPPFGAGPGAHIERLIMPVVTLSLAFLAIIARMTRASVGETLRQDWVRTATSIGYRPNVVFRDHVVRNSLNPVITVIGLEIGTFLGSSVIIERVFNLPGLSSLLIDGVTSRDYPVVQGVVIVISVLFVVINLIVDIVYGLLDPRTRQR
ncbi:ABC transporter permease [Gryllotalpicola koreensis]|uniref:ABC transporter permease n=1 Tax=Gryllotalpicola koreensis TaxID=993086 RepID=A0ABP8AA96_9MICO